MNKLWMVQFLELIVNYNGVLNQDGKLANNLCQVSQDQALMELSLL